LLLTLLAAAAVAATSLQTAGQRWWAHILYLADDSLEGRETGSPGYLKAADYVARHFAEWGLKPVGVSGPFQPVRFRTRRIEEEHSGLALIREGKSEPLVLGEDAIISLRVEPAPHLEAPLVFVGYGIAIPEKGYDDFAGLDLQGKIAVYFSGGPSSIPGPLRAHAESSGERSKALRRAGAIGWIAIFDPHHSDRPWSRNAEARFQTSMSLADPALDETGGQKLALNFNPAHAAKLFEGSGHTFEEILALADEGKPLPTFPLTASLEARAGFVGGEAESPNVVFAYPGTDPKLKDELVVLTAHLDHLGVGQPVDGDRIYNGAMDNASGVATLLETARELHDTHARLRRSVLFVVVCGEEKGLLGSKFFAAHPTVPPDSIVADINVDMFLPIYPLKSLIVYGLDESDLGDRIREVSAPLGIAIQPDPEPQRNIFIRSDQYSFIRHGIPALDFSVGFAPGSPEAATHKEWLTNHYHAPSDDTRQYVDLAAAATYNRVVFDLVRAVADQPQRPRWKADSFFQRFAHAAHE
jgi:Zn-dependent M28 family amino/carboxypeptidase